MHERKMISNHAVGETMATYVAQRRALPAGRDRPGFVSVASERDGL